MKKFKSIIWGLVLIALGIIVALNVLGVTDIDLFFDGWWTLFIIVPCFIGLFGNGSKTGDLIGLFVGIALLLICQNIIDIDMTMKLVLPAVLIIIGISVIFKNTSERKISDKIEKLKSKSKRENAQNNEYCAAFSGQDFNFSGEVFTGASFSAIFGGIKCDLHDAIIKEDVLINAEAIFGGVDILPPANVKVKVKSTSIFGGATNKAIFTGDDNSPTIYVNATCIFGGVDIK